MDKKADISSLTPKQEKFCQSIAAGMNASDAYRSAYKVGVKTKAETVNQAASRIMADSNVSARVAVLMSKVVERAEITAADVLREAMRLATFDIRKLYKADGSPIPIHELDDDTAAAVQGVDISEEYLGTGADRVFVGYTKKYKVADKNSALEKLFKYFGMFEKDNAQKNPIAEMNDDALDRLIAKKAQETNTNLH